MQEKKRSIGKSSGELSAYLRLSIKFKDLSYVFIGLKEVAKDFIAGKDTLIADIEQLTNPPSAKNEVIDLKFKE